MTPNENEKPTVRLVGHDGNAFAVIGACLRAAREAGYSTERLGALTAAFYAAESYDALLAIAMREFNVE